MIYPDLNQARIISEGYDLVPIALELMADMITPIQLFQALKPAFPYCFLLESVENGEKWGRYSFMGMHPKDELMLTRGRMMINDREVMSEGGLLDPFKVVEDFLSTRRCPKLLNLPPLTGGLVGYFGYDSARYVENTLGEGPENVLEIPDIHLNYYEEIIALDHLKQKLILMTHAKTEGDFESQYQEGVKRLEALSVTLSGLILSSVKLDAQGNAPMRMKTPDLAGSATSAIRSNTTKEAFIDKVIKAKQHIYDGDAFQIVLSQRFESLDPPPAFDVYRMLRIANPSPYMFYFKFPDCEIAGASPERMVSVTDGRIMTRPIAGTIRRGVDEAEDKRLEAQLLNDPKERAEHLMLVDLGRNDVGRVAEFGSVEVTTLMKIEHYSKVMHLVSDVEGDLKSGLNCLDALKSVLPAGTLSGAPKVRAMEIIDSLETDRRGLYGGTAGYLALNGDMDTCIAIRTILFKGGKAYVQAGAGIVADSVPEREYDETIGKAGALLNALMEAGRL